MKTTPLIASLLLVTGLGVSLGFAPQNTPGATTAAPQPTTTHSYEIDSVHSTALFRVHHLGAGRFYGRFNTLDGTIEHTPGSERGLAFDVTIPIESVDTNNASLDGHLKSPDFFNAREFEAMTFKSTSARRTAEDRYDVTGDLSIHGVTKTITVPVELTGSADLGRGRRGGFETHFTIKRSEYGMTYGVSNGMLGDETLIIVSMEGKAK
ncbi:MAG: YceI family protein [Phycisphaerales bacterium]|nr:YceI family protein [Phycisphaerae bacterium]NNF43127.1 YceI family protein [Phycisphaerales bacterium]NNM24907.1 YceI family protein [Phycisphaerales bacterium]